MVETIDQFIGEHRFLSNFWWASIEWAGRSWPSVEHAYQAAKTDSFSYQEFIRLSGTPGIAKRRGREAPITEDWEERKIPIMKELVTIKFQDPQLAQRLKNTGKEELIEGNTWGDTFWGVCRGTGKNHLGKILMEVRDNL